MDRRPFLRYPPAMPSYNDRQICIANSMRAWRASLYNVRPRMYIAAKIQSRGVLKSIISPRC